jgi:hypothetical protein
MSGGSAVADDGGSGSATGGSGEKTQVERRTNSADQHRDEGCGDGAASDYVY